MLWTGPEGRVSEWLSERCMYVTPIRLDLLLSTNQISCCKGKCYVRRLSEGFCRGSRVEGKMSRVEGRGSRVEGRGSRVEGGKKAKKVNILYLRSTKWNASLILLRDYAELVALCKVIVWKTHIPVRKQKWPPLLIFAGACHGA